MDMGSEFGVGVVVKGSLQLSGGSRRGCGSEAGPGGQRDLESKEKDLEVDAVCV